MTLPDNYQEYKIHGTYNFKGNAIVPCVFVDITLSGIIISDGETGLTDHELSTLRKKGLPIKRV